MYFILLACLNSVIGSSFYNWWETTRLGCWSNRKLDQLMNWTTQKLHLKEFSRAENVMAKLQRLELALQHLETEVKTLHDLHYKTRRKR